VSFSGLGLRVYGLGFRAGGAEQCVVQADRLEDLGFKAGYVGKSEV